ncbi:hypothetical protein HanIR_Chr09g0444311 [Helianthus annuus]|nr:hypothetical protein HanIR_Chr09g0444311 [Helianthus annuus]
MLCLFCQIPITATGDTILILLHSFCLVMFVIFKWRDTATTTGFVVVVFLVTTARSTPTKQRQRDGWKRKRGGGRN